MAFNPQKLLGPFKKHPAWIIGGVVGGAVILYLIYRSQMASGAVTTASTASGGVDPNAALSASTSLQEAALQLQGQQAQIQGTLDLTQLQNAGALAQATLSDQVQLSNIASQQNVAEYETDANKSVSLAGLSTQVDLAGLQTGLQEDIANVNAATTEYSIGTNAQLQGQLATLQAQTVQNVASINAGVNLAQIGANVSIAQILANEQEQISKNNSNASMFGGVLGLVGSLF